MITRICFALLFVGFPLVLGVKIRAQRRALGRSPVVLGRVGQNAVERWFERLSPLGLLFWPAVWLWIALGLAPLRAMPLRAVGLALVATGAALSAGSVFLMGRAWRIGIDPEQRTELADHGPYRWIRHPIYSGWLVMLVGHVLVVPHRVVDVAALATAAGVLFEALREERHMHRTFGERYARYAMRTGRFAPRLGSRRRGNGA
ncbi:MAG: isoprenylcysteine carboxylmethyltransferase family protein [Deltaproteobacteria bacterium]|nr:MAG: isoprenylcysteine carboxylmethyltransferase family protein [Deltaproteobacteria bacterium]